MPGSGLRAFRCRERLGAKFEVPTVTGFAHRECLIQPKVGDMKLSTYQDSPFHIVEEIILDQPLHSAEACNRQTIVSRVGRRVGRHCRFLLVSAFVDALDEERSAKLGQKIF